MTKPLFASTLVRADRIRKFHIHWAHRAGWEAAVHEDNRLIQCRHCSDWHRVEQTLVRFTREIAELREQGWREA
jgi:hypothetical protein